MSLAALAREGGPLWQRACEFNFLLGREADVSRLPSVPPGVLEAMRASPRAARRLTRQVLAAEKVEATPWLDFSEKTRRLALLSGPVLQQLMRLAGVAVYADQLARIVDGVRLREMRQILGVDLLAFAVQRAPFFHKPPAELRARHAGLPEAAAEVGTAVQRAGHESLELCLAGSPAALAQRLALRFPREWSWTLTGSVDPGLRQKTFAFLQRLLVQEISPEGAPWLS